MQQEMELTVNPLPCRTWNALRMNESHLSGVRVKDSFHIDIQEAYTPAQEGQAFPAGIATGMGPDLDRLAEQAGTAPLRFTARAGTQGSVVLHFRCEDAARCFQSVELHAQEGAQLTVIMDYTSPREAGGFAAVQTRLYAEKGARIRLVQLQLLGDRYTVLTDVGARCEEQADAQVLQMLLGAENTYAAYRAELAARGSRMKAEVGYLGRGARRFDMNYEAVHLGPKTRSDILADGILQDEAFKILRGTIDFKTGSSGSEGEEREEALLLGDGVVNQTIPLILCAEEDVQGNHGATIGQLDEDLLFYLSSRGIPEDSVRNMIARGKMDALCRKIGNDPAQRQVQDYLEEVLGNGR